MSINAQIIGLSLDKVLDFQEFRVEKLENQANNTNVFSKIN